MVSSARPGRLALVVHLFLLFDTVDLSSVCRLGLSVGWRGPALGGPVALVFAFSRPKGPPYARTPS
eukprot:scaffold62270_cov63-Phaeocystis_antarctica.AAC.1